MMVVQAQVVTRQMTVEACIRTGQVPPERILSNDSASGMPCDMLEAPEMEWSIDFCFSSPLTESRKDGGT